jgi:DNA-binding transcriptional ArsR family regulator
VNPADVSIDQRLVKALGHPLRVRLLALLNREVASPSEMAEELGEPLGNVSYHVRILLSCECIELVETSTVRGAVEHHYRALMRPFFSERDWARLPASARRSISDATLDQLWHELGEAAEQDSLDRRTDRQLNRTPLVLDEQGWGEVNELVAELRERAFEIQAQSAGRLQARDGGGPPVLSQLVLMHYERPENNPSKPGPEEAPG